MEKYNQDAPKFSKYFVIVPLIVFAVVFSALFVVKNYIKRSAKYTDTSQAEANTPVISESYIEKTSFSNTATEKRETETTKKENDLLPAVSSTREYHTSVTKSGTTYRDYSTRPQSTQPSSSVADLTRATYESNPSHTYTTRYQSNSHTEQRTSSDNTVSRYTVNSTSKPHEINMFFSAEKISTADNKRAKIKISYRIDSNYYLYDYVIHYHTSTDPTERWTVRMAEDCKGKRTSIIVMDHEATIIAEPGDIVYLTLDAQDIGNKAVSKSTIVYL